MSKTFKVTVSDKSTNFGLMEAKKSSGSFAAFTCHRPKDVIEWAKKELFGSNMFSDFLFGDFTVTVKGSDTVLDPELSLTLAKNNTKKSNGGHGLDPDNDELLIKREMSFLNVGLSSCSSSLCCACIIFMFIMMSNQGDGF